MDFSRKAIRTYLSLTIEAYLAGLISNETLLARVFFILGDDYDQANEIGGSESEVGTSSQESRSCGASSPDRPILEFKISKPAHLAQWVFTIGDPDPIPSIPHGHWQSPNNKRKLDPYLGWVYDGPTQTTRLSRSDVAAFWNDSQFRQDALRAIHHALHDPKIMRAARQKIRSRGVQNPYRLPRRRNP